MVEIGNSYVSGVATENFLYLCFFNWGTTGSCLIVTFYLSFWRLTSLSGSDWKIAFWKYGWKQVCFRNYILDNTLDNGTPDGDNNFDDSNDEDNNNNNNHNSDGNHDDK